MKILEWIYGVTTIQIIMYAYCFTMLMASIFAVLRIDIIPRTRWYKRRQHIKQVLMTYKKYGSSYTITAIKSIRNLGYDYPEFKIIEKSIAADIKARNLENTIVINIEFNPQTNRFETTSSTYYGPQ